MRPYRKFCIAVLVFSLGLATAFCQAQAVNGVLIMPVETASDPGFEVLAKTMRETIRLNLALLRDFKSVIHDFPQGQTRYGMDKHQYARVVMRKENCDNAVFVEIDRQRNSEPIRVSVAVYAYASSQTTLEATESLDSVFDIFDAADRLTAALLEGLIGRPVEYGSLRIQPRGTPRPFLVYIDQEFIGEDILSLPALMSDEYILRITQERLWGELELLRAVITIEPKRETLIELTFPATFEKELRQLTDIDSQIRDSLDREDTENAIKLLNDIIGRLDPFKDLPGYEIYGQWRQRYWRWLETLDHNNRLAQLSGNSPGNKNFVPSYPMVYVPPEIRAYLPVDPALVKPILSSATEKLNRLSDIHFRYIQIDGDFSDWEGIKSFNESGSQSARYFKAPDSLFSMRIKSFSLARDNHNLYLRIGMEDSIKIDDIDRRYAPLYRLRILTRTEAVTLSLNWWNGWDCQLFTDGLEGGGYLRIANGNWRNDDASLEMAVPLSALTKYLQPGQYYEVHAYTGSVDLRTTNNPPYSDYHWFSTGLRY